MVRYNYTEYFECLTYMYIEMIFKIHVYKRKGVIICYGQLLLVVLSGS